MLRAPGRRWSRRERLWPRASWLAHRSMGTGLLGPYREGEAAPERTRKRCRIVSRPQGRRLGRSGRHRLRTGFDATFQWPGDGKPIGAPPRGRRRPRGGVGLAGADGRSIDEVFRLIVRGRLGLVEEPVDPAAGRQGVGVLHIVIDGKPPADCPLSEDRSYRSAGRRSRVITGGRGGRLAPRPGP